MQCIFTGCLGVSPSPRNIEMNLAPLKPLLPNREVTSSNQLDGLPGDVLKGIMAYQSGETVNNVSQANRLFRYETWSIRSDLIENKKIFDKFKNQINEQAETIQNIRVITDVNMTQYFYLAKQAVTSNPLKDPHRQRPYAISHIKLDKNGVVGLNPDEFMKVAQIAMKGNIQCITDIRKCVNSSNYDQPEKDEILTDCDRLFSQEGNSCFLGYLTSCLVLFGH